MIDQPLRMEPVGGPETDPRRLDAAGPFLIGRARESDLCLTGSTVSRRHALLLRRDDGWFLSDLGSRHGTFLNGLRLEAEVMTQIASGDLLRVGPFTFRTMLGDASSQRPMETMDAAFAPGAEMRHATDDELESLASRRLQLLVAGADSIYEAATELELGRAVNDLAVRGTGFHRAAFIRVSGDHENPELVATREGDNSFAGPFAFSHSLVVEAMCGEVVQISQTRNVALGQSISQLGIHTAVCAPLVVDGAPVGAVYMDAREGEPPAAEDAVAYCHTLARLTSLALATLRRIDLKSRQRRLEEDIRLARQAQAFLGSPASGELGHVAFAVQSHPGRFIAGDLFDIFEVDEHRVAFCIGDVSGQGLRAGILMTAILSHLRAMMHDDFDLAAVLHRVNRYVAARTEAGMFASLVVGVLDVRTEELRYVDAGHGHWFVRRTNGVLEQAPRPGGLLVGVEATFEYHVVTIPLAKGDRLILYSDGVVEHRGAGGDEFGPDRLRDSLAGATSPGEDVLEAFGALKAFIGDVGLADDTTLASIEIR